MKPRRPLNLNQTITLTLLLVSASVVLGAGALHRLQQSMGRDRERNQRAGFGGALLAADFGRFCRDFGDEGPQQWARNATLHPDALMAAVLDADRTFIAVHPDLPGWWMNEYYRHVPWAPFTAAVTWPPPGAEIGEKESVYVTRLDAPDATQRFANHQLMLVMRSGPGAAFSPSQIWTFHMPLLGISVIGLGLGLFWLRRQVLLPITKLSRMAQKATVTKEVVDWTMPDERCDELGQLSDALSTLYLDNEQWRQRATKLERDFDWRVAAETRHIAVALNRATRDSWLDGLTGLHNRRALEEKLPEFFEAQVHAGHDLSLAMFDLDNFKGLNDTLGHAAGDELLQFVGELLRTALRSGDVAFRYGGDEFLLVCPGVSADAAANIADRLIRLFTQRAKLLTVQPEVSLSAGVASVRRHRPGSAGEMLKMADEALYRVKETGKRGVAIYEPTQEPVVK